jgi:phospholipid-binding lipoprotein MlaA
MQLKFLPLFLVFLLQACAHTKPKHPDDPFEPLNRHIFIFNYQVDQLIYRPIAKCYVKITPSPLQKAIRNFISNLDEIPSFANDVLQLDPYHAVVNGSRFIINSSLGLLGTMDVASQIGIAPHRNDFGLTLHRWGIKKTPYIQIIFLGPSTIRDALGRCGDFYLKPIPHYGFTIVRSVPLRAELLPADPLVKEAIDPYIFVRDAYLQNRQKSIKCTQERPKKLKTLK